jgi:hypothetical protein
MIPKFRVSHDAVDVAPGEKTEISEPYRPASEHPMQDAVNTVEQPERKTLDPSTAFGEDRNRPVRGTKSFDQPGNILRSIFAIRVHNQGGIPWDILLNVRQRHGDRTLMAKVPA